MSEKPKPVPAPTAYGAGLYPAGHYYSPVPDIENVLEDYSRIFPDTSPAVLAGIDLNDNAQLELLLTLKPFMAEAPFSEHKSPQLRYYYENPFYSYTDALFLYGMMRHVKPRRIIEVGSGFSSCVMLDTNEHFMKGGVQLSFVEPYPERLQENIHPTDRIELFQQRVQEVDTSIFERLEENDILFIDSTHVSKVGSDVNYYLFTIFPLLKPGVIIHIHDVFYPFEYPKEWVLGGMYWNENYMLRSFLMHNQAYEILLFSHYLTQFHASALEAAHPLCMRNCGGNLWLRKK